MRGRGIRRDRSYGPKGREACAAAWTCCRTFSCSRPYSNEQLSGPLVNGPETHVRNMLPPASKEANWVLDLLLVVGGARCNNLSVTLKGISWHAPGHWPLEIVLIWKSPEFQWDLFPILWAWKDFTNMSRVIGLLCLPCPIIMFARL